MNFFMSPKKLDFATSEQSASTTASISWWCLVVFVFLVRFVECAYGNIMLLCGILKVGVARVHMLFKEGPASMKNYLKGSKVFGLFRPFHNFIFGSTGSTRLFLSWFLVDTILCMCVTFKFQFCMVL